MHTVLITGAGGFIGRNLCVHLRARPDLQVLTASRDTPEAVLQDAVTKADTIIHLAGVNRPSDTTDFARVNTGYTELLIQMVAGTPRPKHLIFGSSIHAESQSAYGNSKRLAEERLQHLASHHPVTVSAFRLKNVFGKWCKPNYNSVVATFCHNLAHDLPFEIHDPNRTIELAFIDDVVAAITESLIGPPSPAGFYYRGSEIPTTTLSLGELASHLRCFHEMPATLLIPNFSSRFLQQLYATFLSYAAPNATIYRLDARHDPRGSLAEFIKSPSSGQIFVSRTRSGVTRGNHYHHIKTEKFLVLEGDALICLRQIDGDEIIEHRVSGTDYCVVDIPPGFTHSISNTGVKDLITVFWASEIFDADRPDTLPLPVTDSDCTPSTTRQSAA